jgi:phenylacetic acid degradation operon negative regulatory protein
LANPSTPRPQTLLLSFMADYLWRKPIAVSSASVIDVLADAGVSESATRATLLRMVNRELLERHRRGRKMYFGLTPRSTAVLTEGERHVWEPLDRPWDGSWTLLGFSLNENQHAERHALRSRLAWLGFGPMQNGMFIAPGTLDVEPHLQDLELGGRVRVFVGAPAPPTDIDEVIAQAWDLDALADGYRAFLERWDRRGDRDRRPLTQKLLLHAEWLQLVRADPHLPAEHLPSRWPGLRAETVFRRRWAELGPKAASEAEKVIDTVAI